MENWTSNNDSPVCVDNDTYDTWSSWNASQRDLFILDDDGTILFHQNITSGVPDTLESFIISLFSGCTDPFANNYNEDATLNDGTCSYQTEFEDSYTFLGTVESSSYYLSNNALSWQNASQNCNENDGFLATLTSENENTIVSDWVSSSTHWIGLFQNTQSSDYSEPSGGWEWVTGEELNYTNWYSNEPNNSANVAVTNYGGTGFWDDYGQNTNTWILERDSDLELPDIAFSTDSIFQELYMGDSTEQTLTIYNNGEADLVWDLGSSSSRSIHNGFELPSGFRNGLVQSEIYPNATGQVITSIDNSNPELHANSNRDVSFNVLVYNNSNISSIIDQHVDLNANSVGSYSAEDLEDVDVFFNIRNTDNQPNIILEWIYNGGTWIGEWSSNDYPINNWGVIGGSVDGGTSGTQSIAVADQYHWLAQNIDWSQISLPCGGIEFQRNILLDDPDANIIVSSIHSSFGEIPWIVEKSYGDGTIILFNSDYQDSPGACGLPEVITQIAYYGAAIAGKANWLSLSETSGTISPGTSQNIQVKMNARDLDEGEYDAEIFVHSNDLDEPIVEIPVYLTVETPYPEIDVSPISFEENLFTGDSVERAIIISNNGVAELDWNLYATDYQRNGQSFTFTNCDKEGNLGPSQQDCDAEYSGTSLEGYVDVVDGIQEWIVPQSGLYTIEARGAQGGAGTTNGGVLGGLGAYIKGEFNLTAGDRISILVGQQADGVSHGNSNAGGGGGGGTYVVLESETPLLIAGGGGGTGANSGVINENTHGQSGNNGGISSQNSSMSQDGEGGFSGYDGAGGGGFYTDGINSQTVGLGGSSFLNGGAGGEYAEGCSYPCGSFMGYGGFGGGGGVGHAGGGGGGYSGGNGTGTWGNGSWTGGGGSFNTGENQINETGNNPNNGSVVITMDNVIHSWIEFSQTSGTTLINQSDTIIFHINASELEMGSFAGSIDLFSNDPDESELNIPIFLNVIDEAIITEIDDQAMYEDEQLQLIITNNVEAYDYTYNVTTDTSAVTTIIENDTLTVEPIPDWSGEANISLVMTLENDLADTVDFSILVLPVNDPPNLYEEVYYVDEDDTLVTVIVANDGDSLDGAFDNQNLSFTSLNSFVNGNFSLNDSSGELLYIPNPDYFGSDTMICMVTDDGITGYELNPLSDTATIIIQTLPVNDTPVLETLQDTVMYEDSVLNILLTVSDIDNEDITLSASASESAVTIEIIDSILSISSAPNWNDTVFVTVTANDNMERAVDVEDFQLVVLPVNDFPNAYNDVFYIDEDDTLFSILTADDGDFHSSIHDDQNLTFTVLDGFTNGSYSLNESSGDLVYLPSSNFFGSDSMNILVVDDGITGYELDPLSDTAKVVIHTLPINDAPILASIVDTNMFEDSTLIIPVYVYDVDNESITLTAHSSEEEYISIQTEDESIYINSYFNWNGNAIVTVIANDNMGRAIDVQEFQLIVLPVNDAPQFGDLSALTAVGIDFSIPLSAFDIDMDSIIIDFRDDWNYPDWISLDSDPYALSGNAPDEGNFIIPLSLSDGIISVLDTFQLSVQHFSPRITSILDIPDDQGGRVYFHFQKSFFDQPNQTNQFYTIYRLDAIADSLLWVGIETVSAIGNESYVVEVPTLVDSTNENDGVTEFKVLAFTNEGTYHSNPAGGYSLDNLAPEIPGGFNCELIDQVVYLSWDPSEAEDFENFILERSLSNQFNEFENFSINGTEYVDSNIVVSEIYYYRLSAIDYNGNTSLYTDILSAELLTLEEFLPLDFALYQNYPNPFNPLTKIKYDLPKESHVTIQIFDLQGRKINTIIDEKRNPGRSMVTWDAKNDNGESVSAGMYIYMIKAGEYVEKRKMVYLK